VRRTTPETGNRTAMERCGGSRVHGNGGSPARREEARSWPGRRPPFAWWSGGRDRVSASVVWRENRGRGGGSIRGLGSRYSRCVLTLQHLVS
jgi:hypothetical protein